MALLSAREIKNGTTVSPWLKAHFFGSKKKRSLPEIYNFFGLLMKYFPEELGFIFGKPLFFDKTYPKWCRHHRISYWTSCFEFACKDHGGEKALSIVDDLVHEQVQKDANFTRKALYRVDIVWGGWPGSNLLLDTTGPDSFSAEQQ